MVFGIETGVGTWNAIIFAVAFFIVSIVVYILSRLLFSGAHKEGEQAKPFLSGNEEVTKQHVAASNLYWGFTRALKSYYDVVIPAHTGIINDYIGWFVIVLAIVLILVEVF